MEWDPGVNFYHNLIFKSPCVLGLEITTRWRTLPFLTVLSTLDSGVAYGFLSQIAWLFVGFHWATENLNQALSFEPQVLHMAQIAQALEKLVSFGVLRLFSLTEAIQVSNHPV